MTTLFVNLGKNSYNIHIGSGLLSKVGELFNLKRRVAIITDSGVPSEYSRAVAEAADESVIITLPEGECSKSIEAFSRVHGRLIEFGMTRSDCLVAVGGGVVGDLCGFVAASYMRGIDFYNIPTTLLSQVDSSVGGKTAVNHAGIKNVIGAFHQPRGVLIDTDVLKTLPERQISSGAAEAIKMALTFDKELFERLEAEGRDFAVSEEMIARAVDIKRRVVECDERESSLRRVLNFGHTVGHAIEEGSGMSALYHGECVALGMLYVTDERIKPRLISLLRKYGLPTEYSGDIDEALTLISHDKKCEGESICVIFSDEIGSYRIEKLSVEEFIRKIKS